MHGSTEQPEEEPGPTGPSPEGSDSSALAQAAETPKETVSSEVDDISAWVSRICQGFDLPGQKAASEAPEQEEVPAPEEVLAEEPVELEEASESEESPEPEQSPEPELVEQIEVPEDLAEEEPALVLELVAQEGELEEQAEFEEAEPVEETVPQELSEPVRVIELEVPSLQSSDPQEFSPAALDEVVEEIVDEIVDEVVDEVVEVEEPTLPVPTEPSEDSVEQGEDTLDQVRVIKLDPSLTMELEGPKEPEPYQGEALSLQLGPQATLDEQEDAADEQAAADTLLLGIPVEPEEMFELTTDLEPWMPDDEPLDPVEESLSSEPEVPGPPAPLATSVTVNLGSLPSPLAKPREEPAVEVILPEQSLPLKAEGRRQEKLPTGYQNEMIAELSLDSAAFKAENKPEKRPGGNLRSLEQALVQPVPRQLPPGIENRAIAAVGFLSTLESTQRAMVIIVNGTGELQVVVAGGMGEDSLRQTSMRLLKSVLSTNTPLLLLNCSKDARFGKDPVIVEQQIRSIVCVPFRDCVSKARGLLYADNISKPTAFNYRDLSRTEDFARSLATEQHLGGFEHVVSAVSKPEETVEVDRAPAIVPWIFVAAVSLILFMILPALSWSGGESSKPKTAQTPLVVQHETADSETVVVAYLRALESGNFANAYLFLSPRIRAGMSQVAFQNKARAFLETDNNAFEMAKATVIADSVEKETQRSYFIRPLRKDGTKWTWNLKKERDLWYLDSFKGGLEF